MVPLPAQRPKITREYNVAWVTQYTGKKYQKNKDLTKINKNNIAKIKRRDENKRILLSPVNREKYFGI